MEKVVKDMGMEELKETYEYYQLRKRNLSKSELEYLEELKTEINNRNQNIKLNDLAKDLFTTLKIQL